MMTARVVLALCLIGALMAAATLVIGQEEGDGKKPKPPRFFFEKGGGLKRPVDEPKEGEEAEEPEEAVPEEPAEPARPPVPAAFDFEDEGLLAYWSATDGEAILDVTTDEGAAHAGEGCLRLTYVPREGAFQQVMVRPLTDVEGKTLSLWLKTDLATPVSFGVVEQGGAFYQQFCETPPDEWTHVVTPLDSLLLSQDTRDANLRLDAADVVEIRLADLSNLPGELGDALGRKAGVQQLLLDDVAITDEEAPAVGTADEGVLLVDGFERDTIHALAIGGAVLGKGEGAAGDGLEIVCPARTQRWMGVGMAAGHLDLADAEAMAAQFRASAPVMVSFVAEEWDGSKYSQRLKLDPDALWVETELPLDELLLEMDSDDENGELDRDQIRVILIVGDMATVQDFPITIGVDEVMFR